MANAPFAVVSSSGVGTEGKGGGTDAVWRANNKIIFSTFQGVLLHIFFNFN